MTHKISIALLSSELTKVKAEKARAQKATHVTITGYKDALGIAAVNQLPQVRELLEEALMATEQQKSKASPYDEAIADLTSALHHLKSLCPCCDGSGEKRQSDGAGQMETVRCEKCGGSGKVPVK
jgi:DnaJ-class molecular chaperone with C-terminal Zn finger domain